MGMGVALQEMWQHNDQYPDRLRTMLRGMLKQGLGLASGPHSSFMPYHVDAVTLQPFGDGWEDEMAMGRVIEGTFRSLNNLLEHLHQSFFFYLLMQKERFVSIGTYLPSAMLVAANFTIMSIALWIKSGQPESEASNKGKKDGAAKAADKPNLAVERHLFLPLGVVTVCQALGAVPLHLFNHTTASVSHSSHTNPFAVSPALTRSAWSRCLPLHLPCSPSLMRFSHTPFPTFSPPGTRPPPNNTSSPSPSPFSFSACSSPL